LRHVHQARIRPDSPADRGGTTLAYELTERDGTTARNTQRNLDRGFARLKQLLESG
jgi:hypothetical protein